MSILPTMPLSSTRVLICLLAICVGLGGTAHANRIACTETALHAELARINACTDYEGNCSIAGRTITFNCSDVTIRLNQDVPTWQKTCNNGDDADGVQSCETDADCTADPPPCAFLEQACYPRNSGRNCTGAGTPYQCCTGVNTGTCCSGNNSAREVLVDDVTIDGEDRNITFTFDPPCDAFYRNATCGNANALGWVFKVFGSNAVIRNLTIKQVWNGIIFDGTQNGVGLLVEGITFRDSCDGGYHSQRNATGLVFRNNVITNNCDKAVTLNGLEVSSTEFPYYDSQIINNVFSGNRVPMVFIDGRHLAEGNTVLGSGAYTCHSSHVGHEDEMSRDGIVYLKDNVFDGCRWNWKARGNGKTVSLGGNTFKNATYMGVGVHDQAKAMFENDVFESNGGLDSAADLEGGLNVSAGASVDLGGGSINIDGRVLHSQGHNTFLGNKGRQDNTIIDLDVWNRTASQSVVKAENNFWGDADPSDQVLGNVDYSPIAGDAPEAPPPPDDVWRTDAEE